MIKILSKKKIERSKRGNMNHLILINKRICIRSESTLESNVRIQFPSLVEIHDAQLIRSPDFPARWLDIAAKQAQQRGFAAAIRTGEAYSHSRLDHQMNACEQRPVSKCVFNVLELNQLFRPPVCGRKIKIGGANA